jgi:type III pantothenate kinase
MSPANLCIDIGNSRATLGLFQKGKPIFVKSLENRSFPKFLKGFLKRKNTPGLRVAVASVVPSVTAQVRRVLKEIHVPSIFISHAQQMSGIRFKYQPLRSLGIDRAINAYGARHLVGGDCFIVDLGTAVTFDFLSKKGVFEGGLILPGLKTALQSLHEKTALLPQVSLRGPVSILGRATKPAMRSGVLKGYGALTRMLTADFKQHFKLRKFSLIVTGGHAGLLKSHLKGIARLRVDPLFTLKSLDLFLRASNKL